MSMSLNQDVPNVRHGHSAASGYGAAVREHISAEGAAFATLLREQRAERSVTQDDVIAAASVSRSTYLRWESGDIGRPDWKQVREVCVFLGFHPGLAAIALGLLTRDELGMPPEEPTYAPEVVEIGRILAD